MTKKVWYLLCMCVVGFIFLRTIDTKNDRHSNVELVGLAITHANAASTKMTPSLVVLKKPSYKEVMQEIKRYHLKHSDIVFAQAILESDHFSSPLFKRANNLFGMKKAGSRPHVYDFMAGEYIGHNSWKQSVNDYALFQAAYMKGKSREQYFSALSSYASDSRYQSKLQAIIPQIPKLLKQD